MAKKEFNPDAPAAQGYETPHFDALAPRRKKFVLHFAKYHDETEAARAAKYADEACELWGFELGRDPEVVAALEEVTARKMNQAEFSRAAVIERLKAETTVSFTDLCEEKDVMAGWEPDPDNEGEKRAIYVKKWKPKVAEDVEPQFKSCTGLITLSREGNAIFNYAAQQKSRELLAKYMKWDQELADTNPPIAFHFGGLKD